MQAEEQHAAIQGMVVQLAKLRNKLEQKISLSDTELSIPKANNMLSDLGTQLSAWADQLRFTPDEASK